MKEYSNPTCFIASPEFFRSRRLVPTSSAIVQKVLNSEKWEKPWLARRVLINVFGNGLVTAEGDAHRRQRKMLTPAFGVSNLRNIAWVFSSKAGELADVLDALVEKQDNKGIEVLSLISRATLDVIGLAGLPTIFWRF
jgi:cytochrome P450